ncbi:MAG: type VI secretion system tip protein TssI/VgrG [Acidobacteriaceae bacterium]
MSWTQTNRLISLTTPLGEDKLLLAALSGREAISELFSFHLDLLADGTPVDFSKIIGQSVTIAVGRFDGEPRYINGIVSQFAVTGHDNRFIRYQMTVVPWTWKLTRFTDCRIFHNRKVGDILADVFSSRGLGDYTLSLTGSYTPLEYCVQYRETDFQFISRLMEQHGLFYFFQHQENKHIMVIADSPSAHEPCPGQEKAGWNLVAGGVDQADVVTSWRFEQQWRSGKCSLTDYNFTTPSTSLLASEPTIVSVGGNADFELFDYPGGQTTRSEGGSLAKLRMEEEEAIHLVGSGSSVCRAFTAGYRFGLTDHEQNSMNDSYVLTAIQHTASVAGTYTEDEEDHYSNEFTCIPASVPFRPERRTPRPVVRGPQTAVVVGSRTDQGSGDKGGGGDGEEIWVDDYGRVKVLFPWDRANACSCWVRVSQDWAGKGWGAINIPRVGQEVVVSFLEGDPDRPLVTGRVYNAEQVTPYALPHSGTITTFKTRSSTGGGDDNYNELRFEDKTGDEQIFLRGEKDCDTRMKHDSREWIGNDRSLIVKTDQKESVGGDKHLQVDGSQFEKISGDLHLAVDGNLNQKTGQTISIQAGQNLYGKSGLNYAHEAGETIHLKAGATMILEAGAQLSLKVGSNFIDIGPEGIAIQGTLVMINSGGAAGMGCGSTPVAPSSPTDPDEADDGSKGTKMN